MLLDSLAVFAASTESNVSMRFPGSRQDLVIEYSDNDSSAPLSIYSRLEAIDQAEPRELTEYWTEPSSSFALRGAVLREIVEDLEWPGGPVVLLLEEGGKKLQMSAQGSGALEVDVPPNELLAFQCGAPRVRWSYRYRHMRSAFCSMPREFKELGSIGTKVSVDSNGLLKVTHSIPLASLGGASTPADQGGDPYQFLDTQAGQAGRAGVVQYIVLPQDDVGEV